MAKTTKTAKRGVIPSNSKKSLLARSFNLKSRKVQFFVTILVIAIVGGGYMTIKSFAATEKRGYTIQNWGLLMYQQPPNCKIQQISEKDKNNQLVFNIACKYTGGTQPLIQTQGGYTSSSGWYRACAYIKGRAPGLVMNFQNRTIDKGQNAYYNVNQSGYVYYCSPYVWSNASNTIQGWVWNDSSKGDAWYNVGSIWLEKA